MGQNMQMADEIRNQQDVILKEWMAYQLSALTLRRELVKEAELRETSRRFLDLFSEAFATTADSSAPTWKLVKDNLAEISKTRALQGFSPSETAMFVFSLKQPLFDLAQRQAGHDVRDAAGPRALADGRTARGEAGVTGNGRRSGSPPAFSTAAA